MKKRNGSLKLDSEKNKNSTATKVSSNGGTVVTRS